MSTLDHQDWEQYIVHCKVPSTKSGKGAKNKKTYVQDPNKKLEDKIENGDLKHKKVSSDLTNEFKLWRQTKGKTQKEVAQLLNIQVKIVNDFESGKLKHNPQLISKIKRLIKK